jgi:drug/metabolite transporter (DMT)-like permease
MLTLEIGGRDALSLNLFGIICAVASVVTSALYRTRMDDITKEFSPLTSSLYIFLLNGIIVSFCCLPWALSIPVRLIPLGVAIGVAGAVANVAFLSALHLMGSTRISIVGILQRPLVIIAVALILKESLSLIQIAGIILVLAGIQLATVKKKVSAEQKG